MALRRLVIAVSVGAVSLALIPTSIVTLANPTVTTVVVPVTTVSDE